MRQVLFLAAAAGLLSIGATAAHELVTPPPGGYPFPQGVPTMIVGATPHEASTLGYGWVNGRRVLYDQATRKIVYVLQP